MLEALPTSVVLNKVILEKGESHCYVVFNSVEGARLFYNTYNGKQRPKTVPIYMNYVENGMYVFYKVILKYLKCYILVFYC